MKAGVERLMSDKMNFMAENGHEITLVTYEQGTHTLPFPLHKNIKQVDLDTRFFTLKKYGLLRRFIEAIRLQKVFRRRLQKIVDDVHPDIIHCTTYSINLIRAILKLETRARLTIESQVSFDSILKENDFKSKVLFRLFARCYDYCTLKKLKKFDAFFALTKGDAAHWEPFVSKLYIIPNPLTFYPEQIEKKADTQYRIICAGRLNHQKGFDLLIKAFALISDKCPQWHIDIFGDGDEESTLRSLIIQNGLEGKIILNHATDNVFEEFLKSDFFVFSSRFEGWGLVLVEAMSCGIPAISFRCKYGPEDIITDGKDGLLVTDGNIEELAERILWMTNHPEQCRILGKEARITARRYKKDIVIQQWIDIFENLHKKQ